MVAEPNSTHCPWFSPQQLRTNLWVLVFPSTINHSFHSPFPRPHPTFSVLPDNKGGGTHVFMPMVC
jgi:hypothetical protein